MLGRVFWILVGVLLVILGLGLYAPEQFARIVPTRYLDLGDAPLGPFTPYKPALAMLVLLFGLVVIVAALQRRSGASARRRSRPAVLLGTADAEPTGEILADAQQVGAVQT
jgi:hypothetical protein